MENTSPLISVCLITYNQEKFIAAAIDGVLSQSCSPLEIIISDDCSKDNTYDIIKEKVDKYKGNHKVLVSRNSENLGLTAHVNKVCLELATGDYIHLAAGDDILKSDAIEVLWSTISKDHAAVAAAGKLLKINDKGECIEALITRTGNIQSFTLNDYLTERFHISHRLFHRSVMEFFGPLGVGCPTEDTTMLLRSFLLGTVVEIDKALICYRVHTESLSCGSNIFQLSYKEIYKQYIKDIDHAYVNGLIDSSTKEKLYYKYKLYLKRQDIIYSVGSSRSFFLKLGVLCPKIILSGYFSLREKLSLIKRCFFLRNSHK